MKAGLEEARVYLGRMRSAASCLHDPRSLYYGREGHLRLARECGVALNDFTEEAQREILRRSYGMIYVAGCDLRPILDASEWMAEMRTMLQKQPNENKLKKEYDDYEKTSDKDTGGVYRPLQ